MTVATLAGLPGLALPSRPAAPRPDRLVLARGTLFAGLDGAGRAGAQETVDLAHHRRLWGPTPELSLAELTSAVARAGLRGAGGAGFPTDRKLAAMAGRRVSSVVINGNEGEPTSAKDGRLLAHVPHLVLDGAAAVARATGARRIVVRIGDDRPDVVAATRRAAAERTDRGLRWRVVAATHRFVGGEATAVIRDVSGRAPLPADLGLPPADPTTRLRPAAVFLSNVETFARLALAARDVPPTSALVTVSGAVAHPGVYEVPDTWSVGHLLATAGLEAEPELVVTGGWHGSWVTWPQLAPAPLDRAGFDAAGARWGAGALLVLPPEVPPRVVLTAIAERLAAESAGQCAPCVRGLPALAAELAAGGTGESIAAEVSGRGLCAHPTATVAAVRSAQSAIEQLGEL